MTEKKNEFLCCVLKMSMDGKKQYYENIRTRYQPPWPS
jgi:hypothetical protein